MNDQADARSSTGGAVACPRCSSENRPLALYCASCGLALERFCPQCGNDVPPAAKFCDACGTGLAPPPAPPAEDDVEQPERRQLTVMFCDLVDSTALSRRLDPEDLQHVLRCFQKTCQTLVASYDGSIVRYQGDGILVLFGYPQAHEDDAQRAVRAGLAMLREIATLSPLTEKGPIKLSARIGVATGLVVAGELIGSGSAEERSIVGETPNLAARLQSLAQPGRLLLSLSTYRLARHVLECRSLGNHRLKGYSEPVAVYEAVALAERPRLSAGVGRQGQSVFVGRGGELGLLIQFWTRAKQGVGHFVMLQGEAGIGKSRLAAELLRRCRAEHGHVLTGGCSPYFTNSALHPVVELLRGAFAVSDDDTETSVLIKIRALIGADAELPPSVRQLCAALAPSYDGTGGRVVSFTQRQYVQPFDAVVALLLALSERRPVCMILEDLHWVDPSTLQLLDLLVAQVPPARLFVVVTARPEFSSAWLKSGHVDQITLGRLTAAETLFMVERLSAGKALSADARQRLAAKSDGVPLFVEELTRSVLDADEPGVSAAVDDGGAIPAIPESLRDSLMTRLDRLRQAKPLAQLAAVIGRRFEHGLLATAAGLAADDLGERLDRLVAAELIYQRGVAPNAVYHFKHSLIRDIAYDSLLLSRRRELHGRIAESIEQSFPLLADAHPELVARHFTLASKHLKAVRYWHAASEHALRRAADIEAVNHAQEGLRLVTKIDDERLRNELLLGLQVSLGAALATTKGDARPEVEHAYDTALRLCKRLDAERNLFPVLRGLHAVSLLRGPLQRANELGRELVRVAERHDDIAMRSEASRCLGWSLFCSGDMVRGQRAVRHAVELYRQIPLSRQPESDAGGIGLTNLAWMSWFIGEVGAARAYSTQALDLAREIDQPYIIAYALCMSAALHQCCGEPERVLSLTEKAIALAAGQNYPYWVSWGTSLRGWALCRLGEHSEGRDKLRVGLDGYQATGAILFVPYQSCLLAGVLAESGEARPAAGCLRHAAAIEQRQQIGFYAAETRRLAGELECAAGDRDAARSSFSQALAIARLQRAKPLELRAVQSLLQITDSERSARRLQKRARYLAGAIG